MDQIPEDVLSPFLGQRAGLLHVPAGRRSQARTETPDARREVLMIAAGFGTHCTNSHELENSSSIRVKSVKFASFLNPSIWLRSQHARCSFLLFFTTFLLHAADYDLIIR